MLSSGYNSFIVSVEVSNTIHIVWGPWQLFPATSRPTVRPRVVISCDLPRSCSCCRRGGRPWSILAVALRGNAEDYYVPTLEGYQLIRSTGANYCYHPPLNYPDTQVKRTSSSPAQYTKSCQNAFIPSIQIKIRPLPLPITTLFSLLAFIRRRCFILCPIILNISELQQIELSQSTTDDDDDKQSSVTPKYWRYHAHSTFTLTASDCPRGWPCFVFSTGCSS